MQGTDKRARSVISPTRLIPDQWLAGKRTSQFYIFNPAIIRHRGRLLMVYRVDFGRDGAPQGRAACAICELDQDWQVTPGSVVALSDTIVAGGLNHYDPRFLVFRERLFVYYNNNWDTVPNQMYLVELDVDTLQARSSARPLHLAGPRQQIEKNWTFFEHGEDLFAVYQIDPHIVLRVELSEQTPILCRPLHTVAWDTSNYASHYGALRGGTPPVRLGDSYVSIFHSRKNPYSLAAATRSPTVRNLVQIEWVRRFKRWVRDQLNPIRYYGGVYTFAAKPPFAPIYLRPHPILRPEHEDRQQKPTASYLAPRRVVYPCGLVSLDSGQWLVSYGVHDERCVLRTLALSDLALQPVDAAPGHARMNQ